MFKNVNRVFTRVRRSQRVRYLTRLLAYTLALWVYPAAALAHTVEVIDHLSFDYVEIAKVVIYYAVVICHIRHDFDGLTAAAETARTDLCGTAVALATRMKRMVIKCFRLVRTWIQYTVGRRLRR